MRDILEGGLIGLSDRLETRAGFVVVRKWEEKLIFT